MTTLEELFRRQAAFTALTLSTFEKPMEQLTEDDRNRLTRDYIEALHSELVEVLNTRSWKKHRWTPAAGRETLLEELIDVQKYLWGLMQVWSVTLPELAQAFNAKSDVVEQRFKQEHVLPKQIANDRAVMVDIDSTVADWKSGFRCWVEQAYPDLNPSDYFPHVDPALRQRLKDEMHASGGMRELTILPNAWAAIEDLVRAGYVIVWLTARPIQKFPRLANDTVVWLRRQNLPSDYIYWTDLNKHMFMLERFPTAAALFDDKVETVAHALEFGLKAYLVKDGNLMASVERFLSEAER